MERISESFSRDVWAREESLSVEERRKRYKRQKFSTLDEIQLWSATQLQDQEEFQFQQLLSDRILWQTLRGRNLSLSDFHYNPKINSLISIWRGDICSLEIDAIQNAANQSLLGGGGIDGAIHRFAGRELLKETETLGGCDVGQTKISRGYRLPAKYVLHTVGPVGEKRDLLISCYQTTMEVAKHHGVRSVALCGVSTGIFGYSREKACPVALSAIRQWLSIDDNIDHVNCSSLSPNFK